MSRHWGELAVTAARTLPVLPNPSIKSPEHLGGVAVSKRHGATEVRSDYLHVTTSEITTPIGDSEALTPDRHRAHDEGGLPSAPDLGRLDCVRLEG